MTKIKFEKYAGNNQEQCEFVRISVYKEQLTFNLTDFNNLRAAIITAEAMFKAGANLMEFEL